MELSSRQQAFLDLARALLRLDRSVEQVIDRALRGDLGLTLRSMFVLASIDRGERYPGGIARRLNLPPPSITRTLESLVAQGLVTRQRCGEDRRHVEMTLTEHGVEVVGRARAVLSQALADAWPEVPTERALDLASGLEMLVGTEGRARG